MKRLVVGLRFLALCLLVGLVTGGCGPLPVGVDTYIKRWERDTAWGTVIVRQSRTPDGLCIWREITLRRDVGLWTDGRPQFVRATDYHCDDAFDSFYFRSALEKQRANKADLHDLLLFLMYSVIPIPEHPKHLD